jgi:hypothetical protein
MNKNELKIILGGTIGAVTGFALAKIYQIWAILYQVEGLSERGNEWDVEPLWSIANTYPAWTTASFTLICLLIGSSFAYHFNKAK